MDWWRNGRFKQLYREHRYLNTRQRIHEVYTNMGSIYRNPIPPSQPAHRVVPTF